MHDYVAVSLRKLREVLANLSLRKANEGLLVMEDDEELGYIARKVVISAGFVSMQALV